MKMINTAPPVSTTCCSTNPSHARALSLYGGTGHRHVTPQRYSSSLSLSARAILCSFARDGGGEWASGAHRTEPGVLGFRGGLSSASVALAAPRVRTRGPELATAATRGERATPRLGVVDAPARSDERRGGDLSARGAAGVVVARCDDAWRSHSGASSSSLAPPLAPAGDNASGAEAASEEAVSAGSSSVAAACRNHSGSCRLRRLPTIELRLRLLAAAFGAFAVSWSSRRAPAVSAPRMQAPVGQKRISTGAMSARLMYRALRASAEATRNRTRRMWAASDSRSSSEALRDDAAASST